MKYHPYMSGRRGSKRTPDVVPKVRGLKTLVSWFISLVPWLVWVGEVGTNKCWSDTKVHLFCAVTSDITSLVKAHLSYRSLHGGKLISVSVAWKTKVYWYVAVLLPPSPTPSFPLPNRVNPQQCGASPVPIHAPVPSEKSQSSCLRKQRKNKTWIRTYTHPKFELSTSYPPRCFLRHSTTRYEEKIGTVFFSFFIFLSFWSVYALLLTLPVKSSTNVVDSKQSTLSLGQFSTRTWKTLGDNVNPPRLSLYSIGTIRERITLIRHISLSLWNRLRFTDFHSELSYAINLHLRQTWAMWHKSVSLRHRKINSKIVSGNSWICIF